MIPPGARFLFGIEHEALTAVEGTDDVPKKIAAISRFLQRMASLAPSLPGRDGFFNYLGRVYCDLNFHLEFASLECHDPYVLALLHARQERLAAKAVEDLHQEGPRLVLANNNHSGLLEQGVPTYGSHENYLVEKHPSDLTAKILPFLVTRIFAGSGGIQHPTGKFLAGVRPEFMELDVGGDTTHSRAIHSTCREEHLTAHDSQMFRLHLIVGDGHRSRFNQALQLGSTALALKAILFDPKLEKSLARFHQLPRRGSWVKTIKEFNILASPGQPLQVNPLVLDVQRTYLSAARRYADSLEGDLPAWIPRLLEDWESTIDAMERCDRAWLAARLDSFAKYEFYSAVLAEAKCGWSDLPGNLDRFLELALLDQSYHEFARQDSVFSSLERAGVLRHEVGEVVPPGGEPEPFIPETETRAKARASFIKENAGRVDLLMEWMWVFDLRNGMVKEISDPFGTSYGPWKKHASPFEFLSRRPRCSMDDL